MSEPARSLSLKLHNYIAELQRLDQDLKSGAAISATELRELRQALDNVRLTAWTVSELLNARNTKKDPQAVNAFLTGERLRRFREMIGEICSDLDQPGITWPARSIDALREAVNALSEQLGKRAALRSTKP